MSRTYAILNVFFFCSFLPFFWGGGEDKDKGVARIFKGGGITVCHSQGTHTLSCQEYFDTKQISTK